MTNPMRAAIAALFVIALSGGRARANSITVSGYVCVPTADTIQNNLYNTDISGSPFTLWDTPATGTIVFNCAIPQAVPNPSYIELAFSNDNTCPQCSLRDFVSVQYMKMNKGNGVVTSVTTLSSTASGANSGYGLVVSTFSDAYNDSVYTYFLRVTMRRSTTANAQSFANASIW